MQAVKNSRSIVFPHALSVRISDLLRIMIPMGANIACFAPCKTIRVCIHFGTIKIMQIFHIGNSTHAMTKMAIQTDTARRLRAVLICRIP